MKQKIKILKNEFDNLINYSLDEELMNKLRIIMPYSFYNSKTNLNENKKIIDMYKYCKEKMFFYTQLEKKQNAYIILKCSDDINLQDCVSILKNYIDLWKKNYLKGTKKDNEESIKKLIEHLNGKIKNELFLTSLKIKTSLCDEINDLVNPNFYLEEFFEDKENLIKYYEDKIKETRESKIELEIVYGRENLKDEKECFSYINLYNTKINNTGYYFYSDDF